MTSASPVIISVQPQVNGGYGDYVSAIPKYSLERLKRSNIDLSRGYPAKKESADIPVFIDDADRYGTFDFKYIPRGKNADPEKKALFSKAKQVNHLTKYIGTELVGVQLSDLSDKELDELALLIAERVVVFLRDQDLSIQDQWRLGEFWGGGEKHPQAAHVPGYPSVRVISTDIAKASGFKFDFKHSRGSFTSAFHTDLTHLLNPAGITHLHLDHRPKAGGDTVWVSGYAAYDKLSPAFQKFLEGKYAYQHSLDKYVDRENPLGGKKPIERKQLIIRTHPVTGWKSLFVNRAMTSRIDGLEPEESKIILEYLYDVFEKNLDIQVRFNWHSKDGLGTSAIWDNRVSQHYAISDHEYGDGTTDSRHGTRVSSLAEVPFFDPESKSQREALNL